MGRFPHIRTELVASNGCGLIFQDLRYLEPIVLAIDPERQARKSHTGLGRIDHIETAHMTLSARKSGKICGPRHTPIQRCQWASSSLTLRSERPMDAVNGPRYLRTEPFSPGLPIRSVAEFVIISSIGVIRFDRIATRSASPRCNTYDAASWTRPGGRRGWCPNPRPPASKETLR